MKKTQTYLAIIAIIVLVLIIALKQIPSSPTAQLPKEFQTVSFCGVDYQVEKVMIGDVDIMPRIAELATEKPESGVCAELKLDVLDKDIVKTEISQSSYDPDIFSISTIVNSGLNGPSFSFGVRSKSISTIGFDGGFFLGQIK